MSGSKPTVALILEEPVTLSDITKWCDLAASLGINGDAPVDVERHPYKRLSVRAYLSAVGASGTASRDPETGRFIKAVPS